MADVLSDPSSVVKIWHNSCLLELIQNIMFQGIEDVLNVLSFLNWFTFGHAYSVFSFDPLYAIYIFL